MKKVISSIFIYTLLFGGLVSIVYGYHILSIKEIDIYRKTLEKSELYHIQTFTGKIFFAKDVNFQNINNTIYITFDNKKIPVLDVKSVNSTDINGEVIKKVSRNGTMGIILAAVVGLSIIISLILKDYI